MDRGKGTGVAALVALGLVLCLRPVTAGACGTAPRAASPDHELRASEQALDTTPPGQAAIAETAVERDPDEGSYSDGCGGAAACIPMASVGLKVVPPTDDRTPAEELGYRLGGADAARCAWCPEPLRAVDGWVWIIIDYNPEQDISMSFTLAAVDLAGNEGPASAPAEVFDPEDSGGCATLPAGGGLLLLALAALAWRRMQRPQTK